MIMGILRGYCDPIDHASHLVLIGGHRSYMLARDGELQPVGDDLDKALDAFHEAAAVKPREWIEVHGTATCGTTGHVRVTAVGIRTLAAYFDVVPMGSLG